MKRLFLFFTFLIEIACLNAQGFYESIDYHFDDEWFNCWLLDQINISCIKKGSQGWKKLIGRTYVYNNKYSYTLENAPYPYSGGRIRSGKYESSKAAFDSYINQLKTYKNKKFKFVDALDLNNSACTGKLLLVDENNDTIAYDYSHVEKSRHIGAELIDQEYLDLENALLKNLKKEMLNKVLVYAYFSKEKSKRDSSRQSLFYKPGAKDSICPLLPCDSIFVNPYDASFHNTQLSYYTNRLEGIDTIHYSYWKVKNVNLTQRDDWLKIDSICDILDVSMSTPCDYNIKIELYNKQYGDYIFYLELRGAEDAKNIDLPICLYRENNKFYFKNQIKFEKFFTKKDDIDSYIWQPYYRGNYEEYFFQPKTFQKSMSNFKLWIQTVKECLINGDLNIYEQLRNAS